VLDTKSAGLTIVALVAFASNSLLTRFALGSHQIDAAHFTAIRLGAGAVTLALLVRSQAGTWAPLRGGGVVGPVALFGYAAPFSFAYLRIGAAVGALVLFGVVQLTMIAYGMFRGERPSALKWVGLVLAASGLVTLTVPSATRPDPVGLLLMTSAGVAWAVYSLAGRTEPDPIAANARSFLWSGLLAVGLAVSWGAGGASARGVTLAVISGSVTSGMGYAVWYRVLPRLSVMQAAVSQLSVPVLAAFGAAALLDEPLSVGLAASGVAVLTGVGLVLWTRDRDRVDASGR
jgi:drug/metabolite transporter (DMT)-like permease